MAIADPFDLQHYLMEVFAGDQYIFLFLFAVLVIILAAKFRIPVVGILVLTIFGSLILAPFYPWLWVVAALIFAFVIYQYIIKGFK